MLCGWLCSTLPRGSDLQRQAAEFAHGSVGNLLNRTITHGIPVRAVQVEDGRSVLGYGVSANNVVPRPIPVTIGPKEPHCFLWVFQSLFLSDLGYLAVATSINALYLDDSMTDAAEVFRYDYEREKKGYPAAHMQVYGESSTLAELCERAGRDHHTDLHRMHFPVGGKRFRPSLEDIVEFLILEELATPHDGWQDAVAEHRDEFHRRQLAAAVLGDPDTARAALAISDSHDAG